MDFESEQDIEDRKKQQENVSEATSETEENLLPLYKRLMIQRGIDETARADVTRASYGLDDSDAKFLNQVNEKKHMNELKLKQGDDHEIDEFKRKMVELTEENRVRARQLELKNGKPKTEVKSKQKMLLSNCLKRKYPSAMECAAVLPGIGNYNDCSSESQADDSSRSSSDIEDFDSLIPQYNEGVYPIKKRNQGNTDEANDAE